MKPSLNPQADQAAQERFERFAGQLDCISSLLDEERSQWAERAINHRLVLHATGASALLMLGVAAMVNAEWMWAALTFALLGMTFFLICKQNEYEADRLAHECRVSALKRERDSLINFGPSTNNDSHD